jgi:hypothetical protein
MAKTDYSKTEKDIGDSVQKMRIQSLVEGKTINSERSKEYYGLQGDDMRPAAQDPVLIMLSEEAEKEERERKGLGSPEESDEDEDSFLTATSAQALLNDVMTKIRPQSIRFPKRPAPKFSDIAPSERYLERASALYTLRQHILWLKRRHIENRYELLGATLDEVLTYRTASKLTQEELKRIKELNVRAEKVISDLLKKEKMGSDQEIIDQQIKKHKTKRFNVKDSWIPL